MRRSDLREKYGTLNEEQLQPKLLHDFDPRRVENKMAN